MIRGDHIVKGGEEHIRQGVPGRRADERGMVYS